MMANPKYSTPLSAYARLGEENDIIVEINLPSWSPLNESDRIKFISIEAMPQEWAMWAGSPYAPEAEHYMLCQNVNKPSRDRFYVARFIPYKGYFVDRNDRKVSPTHYCPEILGD